MARRVQRRRSPNYAIVTGGARRVRTLVKSVSGQPASSLLRPGTNAYRGVRTLIKRNPSDGLTQPEARQALLTSTAIQAKGVSVDGGGRAARGAIKVKAGIVAPNRGKTVVRPPRLGRLKRR